VKTALILPPTASSFRPVAGVPLIQRTVLAAVRANFDRIVVVGREYTAELRALLRSDERTRAVEVTEAVPTIEGSEVTVIPSDRVLTPATFECMHAVPLDGRPLLFGGAGGDALALCRPALLATVGADSLTGSGAEQLWEALRAHGAEQRSLDGVLCAPVSDEQSVADAEAALCRELRADSAASDGPLAHWIDRRVSLRISRWLVRRTPLRPNHITVIGTVTGLLAAAVLATGTYWAGVAGTLLFLWTTIIDGCDGEVARLTFRESSFGQKFDVITDNIVHVAIFIGLTIGLYHRDPAGHYGLLLAVLLGGFACTSVVTYFFLVRRPGFASSGGTPVTFKGKLRQQILRGMEALMNRDFAYLLVVLALVDRLHWFVWGTAFGTYVFAIGIIWVYRWRAAR
jgi:phosphatidylglycerophosphate synthase